MRLVAALPPNRAARAAALLGFDAPAAHEDAAPAHAGAPSPSIAEAVKPPPAPAEPMPFWRLEEMTFTEDPAPKPAAVASTPQEGLTEDDLRSPGRSLFATPKPLPLAPWAKLWPVLRAALQAGTPGAIADVPAVVRAWGRGELLPRLPRVVRRAWAGRASVWVDRSARLVPFWSDQADVCRRLRKVCGGSGLGVRVLDGRVQAREAARRRDLLGGLRANAETPVFVLGDTRGLWVGGRPGPVALDGAAAAAGGGARGRAVSVPARAAGCRRREGMERRAVGAGAVARRGDRPGGATGGTGRAPAAPRVARRAGAAGAAAGAQAAVARLAGGRVDRG